MDLHTICASWCRTGIMTVWVNWYINLRINTCIYIYVQSSRIITFDCVVFTLLIHQRNPSHSFFTQTFPKTLPPHFLIFCLTLLRASTLSLAERKFAASPAQGNNRGHLRGDNRGYVRETTEVMWWETTEVMWGETAEVMWGRQQKSCEGDNRGHVRGNKKAYVVWCKL